MPAKASGADTSSSTGGTARHREHNQGNQERKATPEQAQAVNRIRRCQPTEFYAILDLESVRKTCSENDIKKAYRKQSLLTHPDKNAHSHADEAFKMVARAFGVLGDKDKRDRYDRFGGDPDSRFGQGAGGGGRPSAGFARRRAGPGFGGWGEDEINPEELFNMFFGGGGMGGPFQGPQFTFNMGGGPGIRVHQFNGPRPRARPRNPGEPEPENSLRDLIIQLFPLIILFILPVLSSIISAIFSSPNSMSSTTTGTSTTAAAMPREFPKMVFEEADPEAGFVEQRSTPGLGINYFVKTTDLKKMSGKKKLHEMDVKAESAYLHALQVGCREERDHKKRLEEHAQGWFFEDQEKMDLAVRYQMPNCARYEHYARAIGGNR